MRNRKNVLVLALLSGLGISAASAEQPDSLKGVKSAVSMQQSTPQQTPAPDAVASTDTSAERPAPTTALPPAPTPTPPPTVSMKPEEMEPLPPPLAELAEPVTPGQVQTLKKKVDGLSRATRSPLVTPVPRISSQTVSLSAGAAIPQVRVFPNVTTTVTFSDITGAPWALAAEPANSNDKQMNVRYVDGAPVVYIQPIVDYVAGNVTVFLKGLPTPIIINVTSQSPADTRSTVQVDYRLDLRIPKRSPDTPVRRAVASDKIGLYDKDLQAFLDGVPPEEATVVKLRNAPPAMRAWMMGDELVLRTDLELRDEFTRTLSAIDGTHVYVLPVTPELTLSEMGKSRSVYVNLN